MSNLDDEILLDLRRGIVLPKLREKFSLYPSEVTKKIQYFENKGYLIDRIFTENGVTYKIVDHYINSLQDKLEILGNRISAIVLADTHIGNINDDFDTIESYYKYAKSKKIPYVIHLGDLLEGPQSVDPSRVRLNNVHQQIEAVVAHYPRIDGVDTIVLLGNHDIRSMKNGIDVSRAIRSRRLDMHFVGVEHCKVTAAGREILLHHPLAIAKAETYDSSIRNLYVNPDFDLILRGHTHSNSIYVNEDGVPVVNVPECLCSLNKNYIAAHKMVVKESELQLESLIFDGEEVSSVLEFKHKFSPKQQVKTITPQDKFKR